MTTWMHQQRLEAAHEVVVASGATSILDLGCGDGDLLVRLLDEPQIERVLAVDVCAGALERLRRRLGARGTDGSVTIEFLHGSMTEVAPELKGFDCAVLIETIEHLAPEELSRLERSVFCNIRPRSVVITTPNAEFNPLLGVPVHRFRHPDHRFEWPRERFRRWAGGVAGRTGYAVTFHDIAGQHPEFGGASQMAVFRDLAELEAAAPPRLKPTDHPR